MSKEITLTEEELKYIIELSFNFGKVDNIIFGYLVSKHNEKIGDEEVDMDLEIGQNMANGLEKMDLVSDESVKQFKDFYENLLKEYKNLEGFNGDLIDQMGENPYYLENAIIEKQS